DERGAGPEAWELPDHFAADRAAAELTDADRERFESVIGGAVVADDSNRIVLANDRAAELLGWDASDLIGYRLVQIIPPDLRAAHLAGFTRLTFTGESRLLGQPVDVAALRRDGSTVDIRLTIEGLAARGGRTAYLAQIEP